MLLFILSGLALGFGALFPESYLCFSLFLLSAFIFRLALAKTKRILLGAFISGVIFHAIAFYWLCNTVQVFGGLSPFLGFLVMLLFCVTGAPQFILAAFFFKRLERNSFLGSLILPSAWLIADFLSPRLFPWEIGHGLIILKQIAGLAEYVGVPLLSFLFVWWGSVLAESFLNKRFGSLVKCIGFTLVFVFIGACRNSIVISEIKKSPALKVGLIQGNLSLEVKGKQAYFAANLNKYLELSKKVAVDLLIWPESVSSKWMPEEVSNLSELGMNFNLNTPLIFGGLAYAPRDSAEIQALINNFPELATKQFVDSFSFKKYNAAIGIDAAGNVLGRYYKKVLMPFGEYIPYSDHFPWIRLSLPMIADFSPGDKDKPIELGEQIKAGTLICYEDLVPSLSREAVNQGANLLVNLTNDAWYGETPASHQHHLLALWRAIETRRYFLRSTNTGYTAIVSPFGESIKPLATFTEDFLVSDVHLLQSKSIYSQLGDLPAQLLVVVLGLLCFRKSA